LSLASSSANAGNSLYGPLRYSTTTFLPSTYPRSRSPCNTECGSGASRGKTLRIPIFRILPAGCADARRGAATTIPAPSSRTNARRSITDHLVDRIKAQAYYVSRGAPHGLSQVTVARDLRRATEWSVARKSPAAGDACPTETDAPMPRVAMRCRGDWERGGKLIRRPVLRPRAVELLARQATGVILVGPVESVAKPADALGLRPQHVAAITGVE